MKTFITIALLCATLLSAQSREKDILTFTIIPEQTGEADIDGLVHNVEIEVEAGTDLTSLAPSWTLSEGATSDPASGTTGDYSTIYNIVVTAEDGSTQNWEIDVELASATAINDDNSIVPDKTHLYNNYPNPFNPTTTIKYDLPKTSETTLKIYDAAGREITTLVSGQQTAGQKSAVWYGKDSFGNPVSSGIYFYRIKAENFQSVKKMILLK